MDFDLNEDQQQIVELARQILDDQATNERVRAVETGPGPRHDAELWSAFAEAGLLGTAIPERHGGSGLGFLEVAAVLEQIGKHLDEAGPHPSTAAQRSVSMQEGAR